MTVLRGFVQTVPIRCAKMGFKKKNHPSNIQHTAPPSQKKTLITSYNTIRRYQKSSAVSEPFRSEKPILKTPRCPLVHPDFDPGDSGREVRKSFMSRGSMVSSYALPKKHALNSEEKAPQKNSDPKGIVTSNFQTTFIHVLYW